MGKTEWRNYLMAKAEVRLTCKTCGKTFTWSKICDNRMAAI